MEAFRPIRRFPTLYPQQDLLDVSRMTISSSVFHLCSLIAIAGGGGFFLSLSLLFFLLPPIPRVKKPLFKISKQLLLLQVDYNYPSLLFFYSFLISSTLKASFFLLTEHVQVRFQLQRECVFGERFHLVGDDPKLGSWDPLSSIPMDWSEGHVWTVELDNMPAKQKIQFKFILLKAGGPENISWQPGPDRILLTWETSKTITVCEDWDDAQLQTIFEEELDLVFQNETQIINGDAISAGEEENDLTPMEESVDTTVVFKNLESREDDHILVPHESTPVLVPGLIPFSNDDDEEEEEEEEESAAADTIKEDQITQPNAMDEVNGSCSSSEMIETDTLVELIQLNGEEDLGNHHVMDLKTEIQDEEDNREGNVLENIILGSSNSLKKFLFGFRFRQ